MRLALRACACACALAGALPALNYLPGDGSLGVLPADMDMPAARRAEEEQQRRFRDGLAEREAVLARAAAKRAVAEELADGRLTLDEAGARMRALNAADTESVRRCRREAMGARTDEEAARREAIAELRLLAHDRPECEATARRLEADLARGARTGAPTTSR